MKKTLRFILIITTFATITGCTNTFQTAYFPDQSLTIEDPEKARIYLICDSPLGFVVRDQITDGNNFVGMSSSSSYLCWEREPGKTTVSVNSYSKLFNSSDLDLDVAKGKVYYIQLHRWPSIMVPIYSLELVDEEKGKKLLKNCKPVLNKAVEKR